jgi:hypothetical protein
MAVFRVLVGFLIACLVAAGTLILFVYTPVEFATLPSDISSDRLSEAALFALVVTPHIVLFAGIPALICMLYAERRGIASWGYYVLLGIALAALGFLIQHFSEAPGQATILHNYALVAFLAAGAIGGLAYWVISGRYAASHEAVPRRATPPPAAATAGK